MKPSGSNSNSIRKISSSPTNSSELQQNLGSNYRQQFGSQKKSTNNNNIQIGKKHSSMMDPHFTDKKRQEGLNRESQSSEY